MKPEDQEHVRRVTEAILGNSEQWLRDFAHHWGMDYQDMVSTAAGPEGSWGRYLTAHGRDLHGSHELGDDLDKFWEHMEVITGREFDEAHRQNTGWSCSC